MANVDNPHGLRPLMRTLNGGCPVVRQYIKDSAEATAIFINDVVQRQADGNIAAGGTPGTTLFLGVALNYGAASQQTDHLVIVSPDAIFEAQDNNDTDGFAAADMGLNCNLEFNAGNAQSYISGHELDESTAGTNASLDVKLLDKLDVPDNEYGPNCRVQVVFNKHLFAKGVAGV